MQSHVWRSFALPAFQLIVLESALTIFVCRSWTWLACVMAYTSEWIPVIVIISILSCIALPRAQKWIDIATGAVRNNILTKIAILWIIIKVEPCITLSASKRFIAYCTIRKCFLTIFTLSPVWGWLVFLYALMTLVKSSRVQLAKSALFNVAVSNTFITLNKYSLSYTRPTTHILIIINTALITKFYKICTLYRTSHLIGWKIEFALTFGTFYLLTYILLTINTVRNKLMTI